MYQSEIRCSLFNSSFIYSWAAYSEEAYLFMAFLFAQPSSKWKLDGTLQMNNITFTLMKFLQEVNFFFFFFKLKTSHLILALSK